MTKIGGNPATTYLSQKELAARWGISERTLQDWRYKGIGPEYIRAGYKLVRYSEDAVLRFEQQTS
jgi:DNA-binding transcriptional MerR regulator